MKANHVTPRELAQAERALARHLRGPNEPDGQTALCEALRIAFRILSDEQFGEYQRVRRARFMERTRMTPAAARASYKVRDSDDWIARLLRPIF